MDETIEQNYSYHKPMEDTVKTHELIRNEGKRMAYVIEEECPTSREKSLAMTKLEEAVMWANASIARNLSAAQPKIGGSE